jgi:hypothetical protein
MAPGLLRNGASILVIVAALVAGGCQANGVAPPAVQNLRPGSTYLLHVPGIAGDTIFDRNWMGALKAGGAAEAVELFDWTCNDAGIDALRAYARNRRQAARLAERIAARAADDPTGRIVLTAESGGAAIAIWALERLPAAIKVNEAVLVAPALSPTYDLSAALRHVSGRMTYFSSRGDWFVLGFGTRVFGTSDGRNVEAAGYVGFHRPEAGDASQYRKLVQMPYDPAWMQWGDFGSHTGALSPPFAHYFLAPLLARDGHQERDARWSGPIVCGTAP